MGIFVPKLWCCDYHNSNVGCSKKLPGVSKCPSRPTPSKKCIIQSMNPTKNTNILCKITNHHFFLRHPVYIYIYIYIYHKDGKVGGDSSALGRHVREKHGDNHNIKFSKRVLAHYLSLTHQHQVADAATIDSIEDDKLINTRVEKGLDLVRVASQSVSRHRPAVVPGSRS